MVQTGYSGIMRKNWGDIGLDYKYNYPNNLDLRPKSQLHREIVDRLGEMTKESHSVMSRRYSDWQAIDHTLTAYIPTDEEEDELLAVDSRTPVSVVVPVSLSILETLMSSFTAGFLDRPYFKYGGVGPEDRLKAIMLEHIVDIHTVRFKVGLNMMTQWRDQFAYGLGVVTPTWDVIRGRRTTVEDTSFFDALSGIFTGNGSRRRRSRVRTLFEGNRLDNIDIYRYLPDPNFPPHEVQRGRYVGWSSRETYMSLLEDEEYSTEDLFNVKYIKHIDGHSAMFMSDQSGRQTKTGTNVMLGSTENQPVDVTYMYVKLIPAEWKLGRSERIEKWRFVVAGDEVIIGAKPLGLDHDMFPVAVTAPYFDGHSATPVSPLEILYGLQKYADWCVNSHKANQRKALNDMFVVDPQLVNIHDVRDPGPGKIIRMRESMWGRGVQGIEQLKVTDVTAGNMVDLGIITQIMNKAVGTPDQIQGVMRTGPERMAGSEAKNVALAALSRVKRMATVTSIMSNHDVAMMFAYHTQQLMKQNVYSELAGEWEDLFRRQYPSFDTEKPFEIKPKDIVVDFDVIPVDPNIGGDEHMDTLVQMLQIIVQSEELSKEIDVPTLVKHIFRVGGFKDVEAFVRRRGGQANVSVMPDEEVGEEVTKGNLRPIGAGVN
ncbi:hypothetical protein LCGC14_1433050 [marine sediment metagenome]|uniref:Portal protein n=1 Tax=marine sediment metagenome TaxID=412755 RepID=A0A0F9MPU6_9ZZZZ